MMCWRLVYVGQPVWWSNRGTVFCQRLEEGSTLVEMPDLREEGQHMLVVT